MNNINKNKIPREVVETAKTLEKADFEAFLVGGCVRDMILDKKPKDWDLTTNATPEEIQSLFKHTFYENSYGTVGVVIDNENFDFIDKVSQETVGNVSHETNNMVSQETYGEYRMFPEEKVIHETSNIIEITPYRIESEYTDGRRPNSVEFSKNIDDDLKRRDFTMNAIAYNVSQETLYDPFNGLGDIKNSLIKTVGSAQERFKEDGLRIMRAVRFQAELGFAIDTETQKGMEVSRETLKLVSNERIRDELVKIIMSDNPMLALVLANKLDILKYILPDVERGIDIKQNGDHIYTVWEHNLRALQHGADKKYPLHVRLSALLHDVSKPETRRWSKKKNNYTFYGHDVVGAKVAKKILQNLKFSHETVDVVEKLVRYHLFFSDVENITLSAVRRLVRAVGPENVWDLMKLRTCDRIGMGRPKEEPYRLRKYYAMIEEATKAPVSVGMLKIDGQKIMELLNIKPSAKIGLILNALLEEVLENPDLNTQEYMQKRTLQLDKLPEKDLKDMADEGKKKKEEEEAKEIEEIRKKHGVK